MLPFDRDYEPASKGQLAYKLPVQSAKTAPLVDAVHQGWAAAGAYVPVWAWREDRPFVPDDDPGNFTANNANDGLKLHEVTPIVRPSRDDTWSGLSDKDRILEVRAFGESIEVEAVAYEKGSAGEMTNSAAAGALFGVPNGWAADLLRVPADEDVWLRFRVAEADSGPELYQLAVREWRFDNPIYRNRNDNEMLVFGTDLVAAADDGANIEAWENDGVGTQFVTSESTPQLSLEDPADMVSSVYFDGSESMVTDNAIDVTDDESYVFGCAFTARSTSGTQAIFDVDDGRLQMRVDSGDVVVEHAEDMSAGSTTTVSDSISSDEWYVVLAYFDSAAGRLLLYVDGDTVDSRPVSTLDGDNGVDAKLGQTVEGGDGFDGKVAMPLFMQYPTLPSRDVEHLRAYYELRTGVQS